MILGVLQARATSRRLPNKVLLPILGEPMLWRQIERVRRANRLDGLVVATSTDIADEPIARLCAERSIDCFRGSLEDVLDRFYQASRKYGPKFVVRLTGDCPLVDPELLDRVVDLAVREDHDWTGNAVQPTFPDGLDVEVVKFDALERAWKNAKLASEREHVTPYLYQNPEFFKIAHYKGPTDLSALRWTVDCQEDLELVRAVYEALYPARHDFSTDDILAHLEANPRLKTINKQYARNEGYQKSVEADGRATKT